ncbi:MAG TPA: hypothetical protein VF509_10665 [Sphingobium sp.]
MIALMLAVAATVSASAGGHGRHVKTLRPCALSRTCLDVRSGEEGLRLSQSTGSSEDRKMEAYRISGRPCGLIGGFKCPGRGRQIWRLGEPVRQTIARSFGLD